MLAAKTIECVVGGSVELACSIGECFMINKQLRILIADHQHINRWQIEKILNDFGHYSIFPAKDFNEVLSVCQHQSMSFDLLVVNVDTVSKAGIDFMAFFEESANVRHALTYRCRAGIFSRHSRSLVKHMPHLPDKGSIGTILQMMESSSNMRGRSFG
jgi:hypothetical protein